MNPSLDERFAKFVQDQDAAIDELRTFVSGEVGPKLDGSAESLAMLDQYVKTLTVPGWEESSLFGDRSGDKIIRWLTVRVAYYLAWSLQKRFGVKWQLSSDAGAAVYRTPVLVIDGVEISPLEVANAYIRGDVERGLVGLTRDLEEALGR